MRTLRIICQELNTGAACNVGGPVHTYYKTFDVQTPDDVCQWLEKGVRFVERSIVGVEVLPAVDAMGEGK